MHTIPPLLRSFLARFAIVFTRPTFRRVEVLLMAMLLTPGCKTVSNLLRTTSLFQRGHPSSYHRVFSKRRWSSWQLSRIFVEYVVRMFAPNGPVTLVGDDTTLEHKGKHVYGRACHRDAVNASHRYMAYVWGHRWVVLALSAKLPFSRRRWALPLLVCLYRSRSTNDAEDSRHHTPPEIMHALLSLMLRWFPRRQFFFIGDGGFTTHAIANLAVRRPGQLTVVGRFRGDAALFDSPPVRRRRQSVSTNLGRGRPRMKGRKMPSPKSVVKRSSLRRMTVKWYGSGRERIEYVTGDGHWFRPGYGRAVPVRWVFVHDPDQVHLDEYFYSTEPTMSPRRIVETYTQRWSIETMFQEAKQLLKVGSTSSHARQTVLRQTPILLCLYTVVAALFVSLPKKRRVIAIRWNGKLDLAFSDALCDVRRALWESLICYGGEKNLTVEKSPHGMRAMLLDALARAA